MRERLKRTAQRAEANTAAIKADKTAIAQLHSTVNLLVQVVEIHQPNHDATQRNFKKIMTDIKKIRGLRTESQGILEHWFVRQENGE